MIGFVRKFSRTAKIPLVLVLVAVFVLSMRTWLRDADFPLHHIETTTIKQKDPTTTVKEKKENNVNNANNNKNEDKIDVHREEPHKLYHYGESDSNNAKPKDTTTKTSTTTKNMNIYHYKYNHRQPFPCQRTLCGTHSMWPKPVNIQCCNNMTLGPISWARDTSFAVSLAPRKKININYNGHGGATARYFMMKGRTIQGLYSAAQSCKESIDDGVLRSGDTLLSLGKITVSVTSDTNTLDTQFGRVNNTIVNTSAFSPHKKIPVLKKTKTDHPEYYQIVFALDGEFDGTDHSNPKFTGSVHAFITANTVFGVLHAFKSLTAMLSRASTDCSVTAPLPLMIEDYPEYSHRGLILDVAHVFMPVYQIERLIDSMTSVKLNVLHLHLTDTQAFRLEIQSVPQFAGKSCKNKTYYSREALMNLTEYAQYRGVLLMKELDIPGHAGGWVPGIGHNKQVVLQGQFTETKKVSHQLNPAHDDTYKIIEVMMEELVEDAVSKSYPCTNLLHLGGDEVDTNTYARLRPNTTAFEMWAEFDKRIRQGNALRKFLACASKYVWINESDMVRKYDSRNSIVQWEESFALRPPKHNTIIEVWRSVEKNHTLLDIVQAGYRVLVTSIHYWYLDKKFLRPWQQVYNFDPLMSGSQKNGRVIPKRFWQQVLGGEVGCWGDCMPRSGDIETLPWEALVAAAERLWIPRVLSHKKHSVKDPVDDDVLERHALALSMLKRTWKS
eukprot:m.345247 g.345247  ORF g.345247 m.345247 type:complete len:725 (-) comp25983_c0_seq1:119-2293(-)